MKKFTALFLAITTCFLLSSCSLGRSEAKALDVIKTYVTALEENDTETQQECMDPSVNAFSKGAVDSLGNLFGISGAYDMANGAAGILGYASEQALGIELEYKYKDVISENLSDNDGDITVKYEIVVANKETKEKASQDVSWTFHMVKKDSEWYIMSFDEPQAILSDVQIEEQEAYNAVGTTIQDIDEGYDFSDDVAWVRWNEPVSGYETPKPKYYCVDTKGTILFELEEEEEPCSKGFIKGTCVVGKKYTEDCVWRIIDKTGKTIKELTDGDVVFEEPCITDNGYIIVDAIYNDIQGSKRKYGLLDSNGEWVIQPTADISSIEHSGDSVFLLSYFANGEDYFNAETGTEFDVKVWLDEYGREIETKVSDFNDGYAVFLLKNDVYRVSTEGVVEKLFTPFDGTGDYRCGKLSDGLIFIEDTLYNSYDCGFYDINGNLVIDLSGYNIEHSIDIDEMYFKDGYHAMYVNGFCLFIDTKGNNVFEPVELEDDYICFSDGVLRINEAEGICFYDTQGNRLYGPAENTTAIPKTYSCGLGKISSNGTHYVDKRGNIVF